MIEKEKKAEAARIIERLGREKSLDFEAIEFFVRSAMLQAGARVVEQVLTQVGRGRRTEPLLCADNHVRCPMESLGLREKAIRTILGPVRFARSAFQCPVCGKTRYPGDEALGVVNTSFSPGMRHLIAHAGSDTGFRGAAKNLHLYAALELDAKDIERVAEEMGRRVDDWMGQQGTLALVSRPPEGTLDTLYVCYDGTGAPIRKKELEGVKGKNGNAHTKEVKLGCVFTQTEVDDEGRPVREENSTTYAGAIENSTDFGYRIHAEAVRRGIRGAREAVVITDGAIYNKTIAREHFPKATHIIDLYHARERLADFARDVPRQKLDAPFHRRLRHLLDEGEIDRLIDKMEKSLPRNGPRRTHGKKQIAYFRKNAPLMRYREFRKRGFFVGSGVIEAGCRTVVGQRLKNSGMFWSVRGANAILALRCCIMSGRFEQFCEDQAA